MFGKNSKMSKNVQKSKTPRQQTSNVEASNEMKGSAKNCNSTSSSSKTSSKACGKSSTNAKNCK